MDMNGIINGIMKNAEKSAKCEDDYVKDGLVYCGKCHTPKQVEIMILGQKRKPFCLCKCGSERKRKEEEERKRREFERMVEHNRVAGLPDREMWEWKFANDDLTNKKITTAMQRYVENFDAFRKSGQGLLLYGDCGTGKTFAACEVANALIDKGYACLVTNFSKMLNTLQGTYEKQTYIDRLNRYSLIVIDDLGIERNTEYAKEQVYNIIDGRYRSGLPMIITTNMTMDNIKNAPDTESKRIYDRIIERCFPILVDGTSRRRKSVWNNYAEVKNLLGL